MANGRQHPSWRALAKKSERHQRHGVSIKRRKRNRRHGIISAAWRHQQQHRKSENISSGSNIGSISA